MRFVAQQKKRLASLSGRLSPRGLEEMSSVIGSTLLPEGSIVDPVIEQHSGSVAQSISVNQD
jgi:hypothetical protein